MKVLYIGYYKEDSEWGKITSNNILALDAAGIDVVCRNFKLTKDRDITGRLKELEQKDTQNCDICIQHLLPHHLIGTDKFKKNIAFLETESIGIKHLPWFENLQQMDEVWVPNTQLKNALEDDKLGIPVSVVPHAFDLGKYTQKYPDIKIPEAEGQFKFYFIGDWSQRQNIDSIVSCFHGEFDKSEDASLILKIRQFGIDSEQLKSRVDAMLGSVKESLRIYNDARNYKKDITITADVSEENTYSLHQYCDCFISTSHGESWPMSAFDAMAFGNKPICSDFGGAREFITDDENTGKKIEGTYSTCRCSDSPFKDVFTGRENWFVPCERQIKRQMRKYYEQHKKDTIQTKREAKIAGLKRAQDFSYEQVGNKMKELLNV